MTAARVAYPYGAGHPVPVSSAPVPGGMVGMPGAVGTYAAGGAGAYMMEPGLGFANAMCGGGGYAGMTGTDTMGSGARAPPPEPPRRMTEGLPTPQSVEQQKQAYARSLDSQLEQGKRAISDQCAQAKAILAEQAEGKKMAYALQVEEQLMQQEMNLDLQTHEQIMALHQAAFQQKNQLESQASNLTLEYRQKQMQEQLEQKRYEMQLRFSDLKARNQDKQGGGMNFQQGCGGQEPPREQYGVPSGQWGAPATVPNGPYPSASPTGQAMQGGAPPMQYASVSPTGCVVPPTAVAGFAGASPSAAGGSIQASQCAGAPMSYHSISPTAAPPTVPAVPYANASPCAAGGSVQARPPDGDDKVPATIYGGLPAGH